MMDLALSSKQFHVALLLSSRLSHLTENILTVGTLPLECGDLGRKLDAFA